MEVNNILDAVNYLSIIFYMFKFIMDISLFFSFCHNKLYIYKFFFYIFASTLIPTNPLSNAQAHLFMQNFLTHFSRFYKNSMWMFDPRSFPTLLPRPPSPQRSNKFFRRGWWGTGWSNKLRRPSAQSLYISCCKNIHRSVFAATDNNTIQRRLCLCGRIVPT